MALRWYTTVIDCHDHRAQSRWWAGVLGWEVFHESDDEAVVIPPWAAEFSERLPFHQVPPGLVFVPVEEGKTVKNRLHIDLAPHIDDDREAEIARLVGLGARAVEVGQSRTADANWTVLADPEGNEFCVLSPRE